MALTAAVSVGFVPSYGVAIPRRRRHGGSNSSSIPMGSLRLRCTSFTVVRSSVGAQSGGEVLTESLSAVKKNIVDHAASWKAFVERVSGEWDGYGADFNFLGEPSELPSQVVPDAFKDWGVEVHDWQTMCPTLGQEEPQSLSYKVIRLLPTVGCEADAATPYCIEEKDVGTALTYSFHANGSYIVVWPGKGVVKNNADPGRTEKIVFRKLDGETEWEVEHCLVNEGGSARNRARILQQFRVDERTKSPQLKNITVYIEQWDGPFRNGESLGGCSTSGSGFATTPSLQAKNLSGTWLVDIFSTREGQSSPNLLAFEGSRDVERAEMGQVVALPNNLWSSFKASEVSTSFIIEAGWLVNTDQSIISSLELLPSGEFQASNIRFEQRR